MRKLEIESGEYENYKIVMRQINLVSCWGSCLVMTFIQLPPIRYCTSH